jgi:ketosteroid isomerase-like protein
LAAHAQTRSPEEQKLIALCNQWSDAEVKHDEAALNRILDDNFFVVWPSGSINAGKSAFIEVVRKFTFTGVKAEFRRIQVEGDTAIVAAIFTVRSASGTDDPPLLISATFVKRHGVWRALGEHIGEIPAPK